MAKRRSLAYEKPWWYERSIANAGSPLSLSHSGSGLEGMVGVSGFAPVAAPEKPPVQKPSYEPDSDPKPEYQPEPSGGRGIPPKKPPVRKGLSDWKKVAILAALPTALTAYLAYEALTHGQSDAVSTPTPAATTTAAPTFTLIPTPTATPLPGLEYILSEEKAIELAASFKPNQPITKESLDQIDAINKTFYFRLTGSTFESSGFVTKLLRAEEYKALQGKPGGTLRDSIGSIATVGDKTLVYVDVDGSHIKEYGPLSILRVVLRETANAEVGRRSLRNMDLGIKDVPAFLKEVSDKYGLGDTSDLNIGWIGIESLMNLYQAAVTHKLEERGISFGPPASKKDIENTVGGIVSSKNFFFQSMAVAWYMALNRADTAESLRSTGRITSEQAYSLFDETLKNTRTREGMGLRVVEVVTAVRAAPQYADQIKKAAIVSQRSVLGVHYP